MAKPRPRSAAMIASVSSVLPEPERGAATTTPLAKDNPPEVPDIPVQNFSIPVHGPEHNYRRRGQFAEGVHFSQHGFRDRLIGQRSMRDDRQPLEGIASRRDQPGSDRL